MSKVCNIRDIVYGCDGFRIQIRQNPTFFSKSDRYLKSDYVGLEIFAARMCWLWRNIVHTCLRSLGQIDTGNICLIVL